MINYDEFDQLQLFDQQLDASNLNEYVSFDHLISDSNEKVYCKLDYYSCMFYNKSISEVLDWLHLEKDFASDFFKNEIVTSSGMGGDIVRLRYNAVNIDVKSYYYPSGIDDITFFGLSVPSIRLDISGKGLDFLRSNGFEVDKYFRDESYSMGEDFQKITRIDFAFDFVNYKGDILQQLFDYVDTNHTDSDRVVMKGGSSLTYTKKTGKESTLYIGAPQSKQLLRVYDKRKQNIDRQSGLYTGDNPYGSPDSWIRFELQLRRNYASRIAFGNGDFLSVLHYIHDYYNFADLSTPAHRREVAQFWQDFYDWTAIPSIIQNLHFTEPKRPVYERVTNSRYYWARSFVEFVTLHGWVQTFYFLNYFIRKMQYYTKSRFPDNDQRRWNVFLNDCNSLHISDFDKNASGLVLNDNKDVVFTITCKDLIDIENILINNNFTQDPFNLDLF